MPEPYVVVTLTDIERAAGDSERAGYWVRANWIRSQAQEIQIEWERIYNPPLRRPSSDGLCIGPSTAPSQPSPNKDT